MASFITNNKTYLGKNRVENLTYSELLLCPLCGGVLWLPKACQNCETSYCSPCIKVRQMESSEPITCPKTCSGFVEHPCSAAVTFILNTLRVKCRNTSYGCTETLPYTSLETHEEVCGYRQLTCDGCQQEIAKKDFKQHNSTCPLVSLQCPECATVYQRKVQEYHTETNCLRIQLQQAREKIPNLKENSKRLVTLSDTDIRLIHNFLTGYDNAVTWQLTHQQNIKKILKPRLEIFFTQLGCNSDTDKDRRINYLITEYKTVLTIWRTHYQNIFKGLQPLLEEAVLDIRNTYNVVNN